MVWRLQCRVIPKFKHAVKGTTYPHYKSQGNWKAILNKMLSLQLTYARLTDASVSIHSCWFHCICTGVKESFNKHMQQGPIATCRIFIDLDSPKETKKIVLVEEFQCKGLVFFP
jgi:hypothetical protein